MRNVIFSAPFPMETTLRFARAVASLPDVRLLGLFQEAPKGADAAIFEHIQLISNALDPDVLEQGCRLLAGHFGPIHRLLGVLEDLQVQLAVVRERLGIEGPTVAVAHAFRDKGHMKDLLRAHGLPCARHSELTSDAMAWSFVDAVGYPIVLKPPSGAGCRATYRIDDADDLRQALSETRPTPGRIVLAEEFLSGTESTWETLTMGGEPVFTSSGRYLPGPLDVMRNSWIQWCIVLPRDISGPDYDEVRRIGRDTIKALGLVDGMTHMEWFKRPDGSLAIGEIAARPPGAQIVKLMGWAHDTDLHLAWARAVVDRAFDGPFERRYAVGIAFLRGMGTGRVVAVDGLDEAQKRMGHLVVEARLPRVGAPRADGYEGEGWAIVRHERTEVVEEALTDLIRTVKVRYG